MHLKNNFRLELVALRDKINYFLSLDDSGSLKPSNSLSPYFYKVFIHWFWLNDYKNWFKK